MSNYRIGGRIIHNDHGPCEVTFVGTDYLGVSFADGSNAMFKYTADIVPWSEKREAEWHAAMRQEKAKKELEAATPWPGSTFHFETEEAEHFMGSHWDSFYEEGVQKILLQLPELFNTALLATGYGDIYKSPRTLPESWEIGFHLSWPVRTKGLMVTIVVDNEAKQNRVISLYPFWIEGNKQHLMLQKVVVWEGGVEAQITGQIGELSITFFDTLYLLNRGWYERGMTYEFLLSGIAYSAAPAEVIEFPYNPPPDQLAWQAELAQARGEEPPSLPKTITMAGAAILMPVSGWDEDDYSFRGPIRQVTPFTDFLGQDGWVVRTTVSRQQGEDVDLDIVVTTRSWQGSGPPEVDQDIDGYLWLQGSLSNVSEDTKAALSKP